MIEAESSTVIRTSREAVWRHLTRTSDWFRWYPGLHGVNTDESITRAGQSWRAVGQMGRMLYRSEQRVEQYQLLSRIEVDGNRRPWLSSCIIHFDLEPSGPNCRLQVRLVAQPGLWLVGRFLLSGMLRRRLQGEADQLTERLRAYVERSMPSQ